jgi:hypothetical protein
MPNPNQRLIRTLVLGWLAFGALGLGFRQLLSGPTVTVIIDRSYCDPAQWRQVADQYADLYSQQAQRQLTIEQVVYVSDLGAIVPDAVPSPDEVRSLNPSGLSDPAEIQQATDANPGATVLICGQ